MKTLEIAELPRGWEKWPKDRQHAFLKARAKRQKDLVRMKALMEKMAKQENFTPFALTLQEPSPKKLRVRIVYGPAMGFVASTLVAFEGERPILTKQLVCGPKEVLWTMLRFIAEIGGNASIEFVHSGQTMEVDRDAFEEWLRHARENPVAALLGTLRLIEVQSDPP